MLEMGITAAQAPPGYASQPPPHTAYFAPAAPTFQEQQPPQTINFQPTPHKTQWMPSQQQQWVPQCPRQSGGSRASNAGKRRKKGQNYNPNGQQWQQNFVASPSVDYNQQWKTTDQQDQYPGQRRNQQQPFGNKIKEHHNLMKCFTCGYDVDHAGFQRQCAKEGHIPNVPHDQSHKVWRACMKGQHKTLTDDTGSGIGWILAKNLHKANYVIEKKQQYYKKWKAQQRT